MPTHRVTVGDQTRDLPIVSVGPVSVALLNLLGDAPLTEAAAAALAARLPPGIEVLVTPEVKAVPLAHALAVRTGLPYVVVRKTEKPYMVDAVRSTVRSITTGVLQDLVIDGADVPRLRGRAVAIVDDVVSTGGTLRALGGLLAEVGATVCATLVVFTEGDERDDIVSLGHLPLYPSPASPEGTVPAT
ncbi:MAG: adenine phosphoribosyltransferase [Trueperaceae bacterium]|nr:adenine phosphoribosyltransferase [Trueperaceae bacterium]